MNKKSNINNNSIKNMKKRKCMADKINNMENYKNIFEIGKILADDEAIKNDKSSYTINNNGLHVKVSKLSDTTITKLENYFTQMSEKNQTTDSDIMHKGSIFNHLTEESANDTHMKLSSKEKKFFKKIHNNTI